MVRNSWGNVARHPKNGHGRRDNIPKRNAMTLFRVTWHDDGSLLEHRISSGSSRNLSLARIDNMKSSLQKIIRDEAGKNLFYSTSYCCICFPVGRPSGHPPPGNWFSWQTKTIQSPWVKGIKLMTNSPSLGGSMNSHKIISFTNCQE